MMIELAYVDTWNLVVNTAIKSANPRSQEYCPHEATHSAQVMDHSRASKVIITIDGQPALLRPGPVDHHGVDQGRDQGAVDKVGSQLAPLRHGAAHNSGGGRTEHEAKEPGGKV